MTRKDPDQVDIGDLLPSTLNDGPESTPLIHLESVETSCSSGFSPDQRRKPQERKSLQSGSINDNSISDIYRHCSEEFEIYKKESSKEESIKYVAGKTTEKSEEDCQLDSRTRMYEEQKVENNKEEIHEDQVGDLNNEVDESMSAVSAITFEYSNLGPPEAASTVSYSPQQYITTVRAKAPSHHDKSTRLSGVHDRVITIQKENKSLKEANLRMMLQMSSSSSSKQNNMNAKHGTVPKIDDETSKRLGKIYGKVQEVQRENVDLKRENLVLRSQLESLMLPIQSSQSFPASSMGLSSSSDIEPRGNLGRNFSMEVNTGMYPSPSIEERQEVDTPKTSTGSPDRSTRTFATIAPMPSDLSANVAAPTPVTKNTSNKSIIHVENTGATKFIACESDRDNHCQGQKEGNSVQSLSSQLIPTQQSSAKQSNKESVAGKKKRRGLGLVPIRNRSDKKVEEMNHKIGELEDRLHKSKSMRSQDIEKIAELEKENIQQRTMIMSLERQIKQSNSIVANLEQQVDSARNEIVDLKDMHNLEKEELQLAYEELKEETANLVNWLKAQLGEYQGKSRYADDIARAQDEDLESLTESEKAALAKEIEEERKNWLEVIEGYDDRPRSQRSITSNGNRSIGASTLTSHSSIVEKP